MCLTCVLRVSYVCRARYVPQSIEGTLTRGHDVYVAVQFGSSFDSATLLLDEEGGAVAVGVRGEGWG